MSFKYKKIFKETKKPEQTAIIPNLKFVEKLTQCGTIFSTRQNFEGIDLGSSHDV